MKICDHVALENVSRKKLEGELCISACDYVKLLYRQFVAACVVS